MKIFKEQVKEIKLWTTLARGGVLVMAVSYLPIGAIFFLDTFMDIQLKINDWCIELMMYLLLFGWVIYGGMFVLAGIGIGKRNVCSGCGKRLKTKELERMGDEFLCPYCHNTEFGKY